MTIRRKTENIQPLHRDVSHKPTDEQHLDEELVGTTLEEERRTTEKAKAVGLCFGRDFGEALGRLGGRWAEGQRHQLQHELYVCFACEHCGRERR